MEGRLELQGLYVEFLEARYPEVLDKLRRLVRGGQVELMVTHYSDQIYLAYPEYDMEKSQELVGEILERNGLERSRVFFTQENFFTPVAPKFVEKHGFEAALIDYTLIRLLEVFWRLREHYAHISLL